MTNLTCQECFLNSDIEASDAQMRSCIQDMQCHDFWWLKVPHRMALTTNMKTSTQPQNASKCTNARQKTNIKIYLGGAPHHTSPQIACLSILASSVLGVSVSFHLRLEHCYWVIILIHILSMLKFTDNRTRGCVDLVHCRIRPSRLLVECRKKQLNHGSFVLLCFV